MVKVTQNQQSQPSTYPVVYSKPQNNSGCQVLPFENPSTPSSPIITNPAPITSTPVNSIPVQAPQVPEYLPLQYTSPDTQTALRVLELNGSNDESRLKAKITKLEAKVSKLLRTSTQRRTPVTNEELWMKLDELSGNVHSRSRAYSLSPNPLVFAANSDIFHWVKTLIRMGADINAQDSSLETALHWAVFNKNSRMTKYLLKMGANPKLKNVHHRDCYQEGTSDEVQKYVKEHYSYKATSELTSMDRLNKALDQLNILNREEDSEDDL